MLPNDSPVPAPDDHQPALSLPTPRPLFVAGEIDAARPPTAHAMPDLGGDARRFGVALCGIPAEHLALVPDLTWAEVSDASRCPDCRQSWQTGLSASSEAST